VIQIVGLFRARAREDVPSVRFRIHIDDGCYVGCIWTDDGRLDKVARGPDVTPDTMIEMEKCLESAAIKWLLSECKNA
jgi:hypothetical protein